MALLAKRHSCDLEPRSRPRSMSKSHLQCSDTWPLTSQNNYVIGLIDFLIRWTKKAPGKNKKNNIENSICTTTIRFTLDVWILTRGVLAPAGARTKIHPVKILLSLFMYLYMCTKFKDNPIVICRDMTIFVTLRSKINSVKVIIKVTL